MSCNKYNKEKKYCGCDKSFEYQGCKIKLDAKCVLYDSQDLSPLGITRGDDLQKVIKRVNSVLCKINDDIDNAFIGTNVGVGAEVYKEQSTDGEEEFRTIVGYIAISSDDTLHVEEDDITLSTSLISE